MKRLAILTLIASPALAHEVPYNNPTYLKITNGNAKAAQQIESVCGASGLGPQGCSDRFAGKGNFAQEAAQACHERMARTTFKFQINGVDLDIPGSRMHKLEGMVWHKEYEKSPETGRMHRHMRSESDENQAVDNYRAELITKAILEKSGFDGSSSKTAGGGVGGGMEFGVTLPIVLTINVTGQTSDSTTKNAALLNDQDRKKIELKAEEARGNFNKGNVEPSVVCYQDEPKCTDGSTNKSYKKEDKKEEKKEEKKSAENPPKHEEVHHDIPETKDVNPAGDKMAGESTIDVSGIATSIDPELAPLSALDRCITTEAKRLNDEFGRKSFDPNATDREREEKDHAEKMLKSGYCDESYFGVDYCRKHKFVQDSVVAIDIQEDRKQAAASALAKFEMGLGCDSNDLGIEFCKKAKEKWIITPIEKDFHFQEDSPFAPLPGIKPGDLPRINP